MFERANKLIDDIFLLTPNEHNARGLVYYKKGELDRALSSFDRAIELNPTDADFFANRGNVYLKQDQSEEALKDFTNAIKLNPTNPDFFLARGNLYLRKWKPDQAIEDFTKYIELLPSPSSAERAHYYYALGKAYCQKNELEIGICFFDRAIKLSPCTAKYYTDRALHYYGKSAVEKKIQDFLMAIKYDPTNAVYNGNLASAYFRQHQYDKAIRYFNIAIQYSSNVSQKAEYYSDRGLSYAHNGQFDEAIRDFDISHDLFLTSPDKFLSPDQASGARIECSYAYILRARFNINKSQYAKAAADAAKAIELHPDKPPADHHYIHGFALQRQAELEFRESLRLIVKALEEQDNEHWSEAAEYYQQSLLLTEEANQHKMQAIAAYNKAMQLNIGVLKNRAGLNVKMLNIDEYLAGRIINYIVTHVDRFPILTIPEKLKSLIDQYPGDRNKLQELLKAAQEKKATAETSVSTVDLSDPVIIGNEIFTPPFQLVADNSDLDTSYLRLGQNNQQDLNLTDDLESDEVKADPEPEKKPEKETIQPIVPAKPSQNLFTKTMSFFKKTPSNEQTVEERIKMIEKAPSVPSNTLGFLWRKKSTSVKKQNDDTEMVKLTAS